MFYVFYGFYGLYAFSVLRTENSLNAWKAQSNSVLLHFIVAKH